MVRAWKTRRSQLDPHFRQTDILGALQLAGEIFGQQSDAGRKDLVIFSDMRQSTPELNLESPKTVPSFSTVAARCGTLPALQNVQVRVLGADGAGKSNVYWESLENFWTAYFRNAGADLQNYQVLRDFQLSN